MAASQNHMEPRPMNKPVIQGLTIKADMHPTSAKFMVGDQELMVMGADIRMRPDEVITATIEVPVSHIDVELMTSGVTIEPIPEPLFAEAIITPFGGKQ